MTSAGNNPGQTFQYKQQLLSDPGFYRTRATKALEHPIISEVSHRDTLDHVAHVIELLEQLDLSEGLTPGARAGLYWIHRMLADSVRHVSDGLRHKPMGQSS